MFDPSMMGGGPGGPPPGVPPSISLGGGGGEQEAGAGGGSVDELLRSALEKIRQAAVKEPDDEDQALIEEIGSKIAKVLANNQKLTDSAIGAGPGVKLVRKAAQGGGGGY